MTSHAPAIPRLRIDIGEWLRARRKPKDQPPDDTTGLHLHDRPLVILKTTAGDHPAELLGACLFEDAIVIRYGFMPPVDLTIISIVSRHGKREKVLPVHESKVVKLYAGIPTRLNLALTFGTVMLTMEGDAQ